MDDKKYTLRKDYEYIIYSAVYHLKSASGRIFVKVKLTYCLAFKFVTNGAKKCSQRFTLADCAVKAADTSRHALFCPTHAGQKSPDQNEPTIPKHIIHLENDG